MNSCLGIIPQACDRNTAYYNWWNIVLCREKMWW